MTSIAEKYAQQWLPNGEVSLADLIQAAVDESQSVAVVGEPAAWRWVDASGKPEGVCIFTGQPSGGALRKAYELGYTPEFVIAKPTHSIPAAELASLREKAAMVDELEQSLGLTERNRMYAADILKRAAFTAGIDGELHNLPDAIDALRKDAERYQKLRAMDWFDSPLCVVKDPKGRISLGTDCPSGTRLDTAVDAAIAQGKGE